MQNIQPIDTTAIEAEISRLQTALDAARQFNATLNGRLFADEVVPLSRGQKIAATRAANRAEAERKAEESRARRSAAMKASWAARSRRTRKTIK